MWDLTIPGNNDHDFYIQAAAAYVLVHNEDAAACGDDAGVNEYDTVPYRPSNSPLENHHGILDTWAKNNIPGYISRAADNPTMALSRASHDVTRQVYRDWLEETTGRRVGGKIDWTQVGPRDVQDLANRMFTAAGAPEGAVSDYYRAFNQYIYGRG
jgi:hypothetical protein